MYGEGHDYAQQYSVSSGDFVGTLPVGMQSRDTTDLPYWPSQNMYVYKEVWVHSSNRWLSLMEQLAAAPRGESPFTLSSRPSADGGITIRLTGRGRGTARYTLRGENLRIADPARSVTYRDGAPATLEWTVRRVDERAPWVAVVVDADDASLRRDLFGW
jgi:hypothetical protein